MSNSCVSVQSIETKEEAVLRLLEEFEYYPKTAKRWRIFPRGKAGWILGAIVLLIGAAGAFVTAQSDVGLGAFPLLVGAMVLILIGCFITVAALDRDELARVNRGIERRVWLASTLLYALVMLLSVVAFGASVYISVMADPTFGEGDLWPDLFVSSSLLIVSSLLITWSIRTDQIRLGLIAVRTRLLTGVWSLWTDTVALASGLGLLVVLLSILDTAGVWILVAITAGVAVIGAHVSRARQSDRNIQELIQSFDSIRIAALPRSSGAASVSLYQAIRHLHLLLNQAPRVLKTPFIFRGVVALCIVADARHIRTDAEQLSFSGEDREGAAKLVYKLSEEDFAEQVGWVFDALLQQVDGTLTPNMRSVKGEDIRSIATRSRQRAGQSQMSSRVTASA